MNEGARLDINQAKVSCPRCHSFIIFDCARVAFRSVDHPQLLENFDLIDSTRGLSQFARQIRPERRGARGEQSLRDWRNGAWRFRLQCEDN